MTVIRADGLTWVAGKDGTAHATAGHELRTLCGVRPLPDRYAWPAQRRCSTCVERAEARRAKGAAIA